MLLNCKLQSGYFLFYEFYLTFFKGSSTRQRNKEKNGKIKRKKKSLCKNTHKKNCASQRMKTMIKIWHQVTQHNESVGTNIEALGLC